MPQTGEKNEAYAYLWRVIPDKATKDVLVKQEKKAVEKTSTLANIKKIKEKANELAKKIL